MSKHAVSTPAAPTAIGPYSQAIRSGDTVYLSGQIPFVSDTMELVSGDIAAEARQVLANLEAVCAAAGGSLKEIVRIGIYLTDLGDFDAVNEVMAAAFEQPYPARSTIQVAGLPRGARIEIDAVMVVG